MNLRKKVLTILAALLCGICSSLQPCLAEEKNDTRFAQGVLSLVGRTHAICTRILEPRNYDEELAQLLDPLTESVDPDSVFLSIYIESMDGDIVYSFNEDEINTAASLYKLPLAVLYYDMINEGDLSLEDTIMLEDYMIEEPSVLAGIYGVGSEIPLQEILDQVILSSDNTAGHMLFENLGGWEAFIDEAAQLAPAYALTSEDTGSENFTTARYMAEVVRRVAENPEEYADLISNMEAALPDHFLNLMIDADLPQKYGAINAVVNSAGFNPDTSSPYIIVVMTEGAGEELIGEISRTVYDWFESLD